jgi:hypothetical protein
MALIIDSDMMLLVSPKPSVGGYRRCFVIYLFWKLLLPKQSERQYNTIGWPYIGPVVRDLEMQVPCVPESICLEESYCMYIWIILMLVKMEPRFALSFIDIIFGNQGLTDQILLNLDI